MDETWRIEMLGGLRAVSRDRILTRFRTRKTAALLAYLAFYFDRSHPREALIELLWPESDPTLGQRSLRTALSSLRHQFEPPGVAHGSVIIADRSFVRLNPEAVRTDVTQFEALCSAACPPGATAARSRRQPGCIAGSCCPASLRSGSSPSDSGWRRRICRRCIG